MRSVAIAALLVAACASTDVTAPPPAAVTTGLQTQETCHPEIPLLDTRDGRSVAPKVIHRVEPIFPEEIRAARTPVDSLVIVEAVVDANGNVTDVCPLKGDSRLLQAVMDAVRQWKFVPGTLDGRPTAFRFNLTTSFRLQSFRH